jgi:pyrroloquinoline quinone biosynthesis protein E
MTQIEKSLSLDGQGKPLWLVLELTYRCPLKCSWCSNPLDFEDYGKRELSTEEWKKVLRDGRELGALATGLYRWRAATARRSGRVGGLR